VFGRSTLSLLHGTENPPQDLIPLRAGPLTAVLDGIDLRYVRFGKTELVRRIYVAVRDRNWNTIAGRASDIELDRHGDSFAVRFVVRHTGQGIDFRWAGSITGSDEGAITFAMEGAAARRILYNRIGFCVLHPWREAAGRRFRAHAAQGPVDGQLPDLVGVQGFKDGIYIPLYPAVSRLDLELPGGGEVTFTFDGDQFETEDQRNWTDASFKTYCTPMALGFPHELADGEAKTQRVTVSASAVAPIPADSARAVTRLSVGARTAGYVPQIGLGLATDSAELSDAETALLRTLAPAHLRCELALDDKHWPNQLASAVAATRALGAQLELILFVDPVRMTGLDALRRALPGVAVARVLVAVADAQTTSPQETTPADVVIAVRDGLGLANVPVAGGTDMYFCELNRTRPAVDEMGGIFWSMNGQVHAFDDRSLMETPEAQGEQVRAARSFDAMTPLFVGPVTLRRRYNVNATVAEQEVTGGLPDSVDPRQASLLGAAWTLASVKHLSEQGAATVTYFETTGWRGVIQGDDDPLRPHEFPARAGEVFPLFHVLADAGELQGAGILPCRTNHPLQIAAVAGARARGGVTMLVANLGPERQEVEISGIAAEARVRRLNEHSAETAIRAPDVFRGSARVETTGRLGLAGYETVRIDT